MEESSSSQECLKLPSYPAESGKAPGEGHLAKSSWEEVVWKKRYENMWHSLSKGVDRGKGPSGRAHQLYARRFRISIERNFGSHFTGTSGSPLTSREKMGHRA